MCKRTVEGVEIVEMCCHCFATVFPEPEGCQKTVTKQMQHIIPVSALSTKPRLPISRSTPLRIASVLLSGSLTAGCLRASLGGGLLGTVACVELFKSLGPEGCQTKKSQNKGDIFPQIKHFQPNLGFPSLPPFPGRAPRREISRLTPALKGVDPPQIAFI
jgi:hypothetical protein